jgi:hypothetical protein
MSDKEQVAIAEKDLHTKKSQGTSMSGPEPVKTGSIPESSDEPGDARMQPGGLVEIKNVDQRFSGRYSVSPVDHTHSDSEYKPEYRRRNDP